VLLEPLYRATFTTPAFWSVEIEGEHGTVGQSFLIAEGRTEGRLSARFLAANYPRRRSDGTLLPDFHGVLETDDGATVLFTWRGYARSAPEGRPRQLVGSVTHLSDDARYRWLNDVVCALAGEVRERPGSAGFDVVVDVIELVWQPLAEGDTAMLAPRAGQGRDTR
jgi:hypothetical protein